MNNCNHQFKVIAVGTLTDMQVCKLCGVRRECYVDLDNKDFIEVWYKDGKIIKRTVNGK